MQENFMIQVNDEVLEDVVGGRGAMKVNNFFVTLQNMSLNAPVGNGTNLVGGLVISAVQGIN